MRGRKDRRLHASSKKSSFSNKNNFFIGSDFDLLKWYSFFSSFSVLFFKSPSLLTNISQPPLLSGKSWISTLCFEVSKPNFSFASSSNSSRNLRELASLYSSESAQIPYCERSRLSQIIFSFYSFITMYSIKMLLFLLPNYIISKITKKGYP